MYHYVTGNAAELVTEYGGTNDGMIVYHHFASKLSGIADDGARTNNAVVCNVHVFHQQIVVAHSCGSARGRSTRDGYVFADTVVVANLAEGVFAGKLQILRFGGNACSGKNLVIVAQSGSVVQSDAVLQVVAVSDHRVAIDVAEWANKIVLSQYGFGVDVGQGTDLVHSFQGDLFILYDLGGEGGFRHYLVAYKHVTFH